MTDLPTASSPGIEGTLLIAESTPLPTETPEELTQDLYLDMQPLEALQNQKTIRVPRNPAFSRKDVVNAFQSAFELIGGVPRLAMWANDNPNEFYKLYGKLLPSTSSSALGEQTKLVIEMAIKPGALDEVT